VHLPVTALRPGTIATAFRGMVIAAMSEPTPNAELNPGIAYLLWCLCLVGFCGIHRFYSGRWFTGLIWVCTAGLLLVGQIVDLFLIPSQCEDPKWRR